MTIGFLSAGWRGAAAALAAMVMLSAAGPGACAPSKPDAADEAVLSPEQFAEAARAGTPELAAVLSAMATLARTLQAENARNCDDLVWADGVTPEGRRAFSPAARAAYANLVRVEMFATAAGKTNPIAHAEVAEEARRRLLGAMQAIHADPESLRIMATTDTRGASLGTLCRTGVDMLTAERTLNSELQAAFMARKLREMQKDLAATPADTR